MPGKLGLNPGDPTRPSLKLTFKDTAPTHPPAASYGLGSWGMLANDQYGDCGPAGVGHQRDQISVYLGDGTFFATDRQTLTFYKQVVPGFDPATDTNDDGVVLQDMLQVALAQGAFDSKPVCFAKVGTDPESIKAAIAIFGSVLFGVTLQTAQQNEPAVWDYSPSPTWGGHCVLAMSYNSTEIGVVSWGAVYSCTPAFLANQLDEAWVVIWPEHLELKEFQSGVDVAALAADYLTLTGQQFPIPAPPEPTPPTPVTPPAPVGVDQELALAFESWKKAKGL